MTQGIYKIENRLNGKVYVGSSVDIERRWKTHRRALRGGCHYNPYLQHSWDKHGEDAFVLTVLEEVETDTLLATEQRCINEYLGRNCYNIARSATSVMLGRTHTKETCRKLSDARKRRVTSEETRCKMRTIMMGNKRGLGYRHTDEARRKMSAASKGHVVSEETRAKIGAAHIGNKYALGHKHTKETLRKMSAVQTGNKNALGCTRSPETRRRVSEAKKGELNPMWGKHHTDETRRKMSIAQRRRQAREKMGNGRGTTSPVSL